MTKKKYCCFYIVRHGETEWNVQEIIQGHTDSPLTKNGLGQAKSAAEKLKNVRFEAAFSSDLLRAKRTAKIIAADHKLVVKTNALLREENFGRFEGVKIEKYREELKDLLDYRDQLSDQERFDYRTDKSMETKREAVSRFLVFLREAALAYAGKKVLIVSHGGIMRDLLVHLGWATHAELAAGTIKNTGYMTVESDGIDFFVRETSGVVKKS